VLNALTEDAARSRILGPEVEILPHVLDETVTQIRVKEIAARMRRAGDQCVICMVGVQSNQYPRAVDLGREFTACGLKTMIGGFHVSGSVEMLPNIPPEIQGAMDEGITIVAGEVERRWNDLLREAYRGTLKPCYNFVDDKPALNNTSPPFTPRDRLVYYIPTRQSSFDAGRGCPFQCSFCTIINVQGRTMRAERRTMWKRSSVGITPRVSGVFITDDNFARHPTGRASSTEFSSCSEGITSH
jgi:hypothetical protein